MSKRVTNSYYPHFAAVVSNEKMDFGTYDDDVYDKDMPDFEPIGHTSDTSTRSLSTVDELSSAQSSIPSPKPSPAEDPASPTTSNTDNASRPGSTGDRSSLENLTLPDTNANNGEVSWSDSDGSTYVSENHASPVDQQHEVPEASPTAAYHHKHNISEGPGSYEDEDSGSEFDSVDLKDSVVTEHHEASMKNVKAQKTRFSTPEVSARVERPPQHDENTRRAYKGYDDQTVGTETASLAYSASVASVERPPGGLYLENVDYYSEVDIASTNEGLSVVGFLSREETRKVFCRRMVPLEVPLRKKNDDDVSAISSLHDGSAMPKVVGDTNSKQTRRGKAQSIARPHATENASPPDRFTRRSKDSNVPKGMEEVVVPFPKVVKQDSLSTLGSGSQQDDSTAEVCALSDDDSECAVRQERRHPNHTRSQSDSNNVEHRPEEFSKESVSTSESAPRGSQGSKPETGMESSTDRRIRELKEKLRKMQKATKLETLPEQTSLADSDQSTSKDSEPTTTPLARQKPVERRGIKGDAKQKQTRETRKAKTSKRQNLTKLKENSEGLQASQPDRDLTKVQIRMSRDVTQEAFVHGSVPSEVTPQLDESDEISTLFCDVELRDHATSDVDLERGLRSQKTSESRHSHKQRRGSGSSPDEEPDCIRKVQDQSVLCGDKLKQRMSTASSHLQQYPLIQKIQAYLNELWVKHMEGKTKTEQMIIGVIVLSAFVLVMLLIAVICKK